METDLAKTGGAGVTLGEISFPMTEGTANVSGGKKRRRKIETGPGVEFPFSITTGSVTVRIYRSLSHGCPTYTLSYYQDGMRKRPSFSSFEKAKAEAQLVARRLGRSDSDVLLLKSAERSAYLRARDLLGTIGVPLESAVAQFTAAQRKLGDIPLNEAVDYFISRHPSRIAPKKVAELVEEFLSAKSADGVSDRYLQALRYCMGKFSNRFHCEIGDVRAVDIDNWLRHTGLSPRSRNNLRNSVQTLISFSKTRGYLPKDHDEIESVPVIKDRGGSIEVFTPVELVEIMTHAGNRLIPFFALGAFAGVRHAEIQRLEWKDIRFDDSIVEIHAGKAKTASRRTVPILNCLRAWLMPCRQTTGPVCSYRNVAYEIRELVKRINAARRAVWVSANKFKDDSRAKADLGIAKQIEGAKVFAQQRESGNPSGRESKGEEGWSAFSWKHNALRHSFISYRVADIQNVHQVALEAGNSPQMIFRHYRELVRPADAKAWFSVLPTSG